MGSFAIVSVLWALIGGAVGSIIGARKQRQEAGFWFGFLLGPIGWILVLAGPDLGPKCPACKGSVIVGATKCKNCGSDLSEPATQPAASPGVDPLYVILAVSVIAMLVVLILAKS